MQRRSLVGRRYEDYLRNNIVIELTRDEMLWRMAMYDPRYNSLVDRRKGPRRKEDVPQVEPFSMLNPEGALMFVKNLAG